MATTTPTSPHAPRKQPPLTDTAAGEPATAPGERLAPPPKLRRRPALVAASVAAICLGSTVSLWAYNSSSNTHDVLAMRRTVERGQVISAEDLMTVKIGIDPALRPVPADRSATVVGKRAALDLPAGGVVTDAQVTDQALPAKGNSIVGVSVTSAMLPVDQIRVGDPVRLVTTPGQQGQITAADPEAIDAVVVGLAKEPNTGNTIVNVQVPHANAPSVAARAATGKVAIVIDSRER